MISPRDRDFQRVQMAGKSINSGCTVCGGAGYLLVVADAGSLIEGWRGDEQNVLRADLLDALNQRLKIPPVLLDRDVLPCTVRKGLNW